MTTVSAIKIYGLETSKIWVMTLTRGHCIQKLVPHPVDPDGYVRGTGPARKVWGHEKSLSMVIEMSLERF